MWIPGRFPSLNDLVASTKVHWGNYSQIKAKATQEIALLARTHLGKWSDGAYIRLEFYEPSKRRDPDGFMSVAMKFILDGLQEAKTIPNDNWRYIKGIVLSWDVSKEDPGIRVTLFDGS